VSRIAGILEDEVDNPAGRDKFWRDAATRWLAQPLAERDRSLSIFSIHFWKIRPLVNWTATEFTVLKGGFKVASMMVTKSTMGGLQHDGQHI